MTMIVKPVFHNGQLTLPDEVKPTDNNGEFYYHHFQSTPGDNLIELAGRTCYESCSNRRSRNSIDYHKHINDVGHLSVQEHLNFTVKQTPRYSLSHIVDTISKICSNRPGIYLRADNESIYITCNIRCLNDWNNHYSSLIDKQYQDELLSVLGHFAKKIAPEAYIGPLVDSVLDTWQLCMGQADQEKWASFYIGGVSRNLSHELIRHKYATAVSQRSTRYVDESESEWAWHPLIEKYRDQIEESINVGLSPTEIEDSGKDSYSLIQNMLEESLIQDGIDKHTARKQSRGGARGVLGTCLSTELIFSASITQWKHIILSRANDGADAEIRILATKVYEHLTNLGYLSPQDFITRPAIDGFGLHIEKAKNLVEAGI